MLYSELSKHFGDMDYFNSYQQPKLMELITTVMNNDNLLKYLPNHVKSFATIYVMGSYFSYFRPESEDEVSGRTTHLNLNFELFMGAGTGKDAIIKRLDKLFNKFNKRAKSKAYALNTQYKEQKESSNGYYCDTFVIEEGTPEGLQGATHDILNQRFGSLRYQHNEMYAMIKTDHARDGLTLTNEIVKCHDADKIHTKKLAKATMKYGGIPFFFWGHTAYQNITDTADKALMFADHLSRGMHRRSMLCFVPDEDIILPKQTKTEYLKSLKTTKLNDTIIEMIEGKLQDIFDRLETDMYEIDYNEVFDPTEVQGIPLQFRTDANDLYNTYCYHITQRLPFETDMTMKELIRSKMVKVKKIATIICISMDTALINVTALQYAMLFVEAMHNNTMEHMQKILNQVSESAIYEMLKLNLHKEYTKTDLLELLQGSRQKRYKEINIELDMIAAMCPNEGYELIYNPRKPKSKIMLIANSVTTTVTTTVTKEVKHETSKSKPYFSTNIHFD